MDPLRTARLRQWLRGAAPRSRLRITRTLVLTPLDGLGWLLVLFALLLAFVYHTFGDRTWWGTALIYTGRWPWLLPIAAVAPLALAWRRSALVPLALAALIVMGPVMGGTLSTAPLLAPGQVAPGPHLQCRGRSRGVACVSASCSTPRVPTSPGFQECGPPMHEALGRLEGWAVIDTTGAVCFLSRYPLRAPPAIDAGAELPRRRWIGVGSALRGHVADRHGDACSCCTWRRRDMACSTSSPIPSNAPRLIDANNLLRETESRVVRRWVDSTAGARIVIGDFNLPVESIIWQQYWSSLDDSFNAAGNGWGFTKLNGWIRVRIDHVLLDDQLKAVGAHVGADWGSDHLPYMAEVQRK